MRGGEVGGEGVEGLRRVDGLGSIYCNVILGVTQSPTFKPFMFYHAGCC